MKPAIFVLPDDQFSKNLGFLRRKYGLSQRSLGKLLHLSATAIKMMKENRWGETLLLEQLVRISQIFDIHINDLIACDLALKQTRGKAIKNP